jgi:hypothetical protein
VQQALSFGLTHSHSVGNLCLLHGILAAEFGHDFVHIFPEFQQDALAESTMES